MIKKASNRRGATWSAGEPTMQPDRHHLGSLQAFSVQIVERVAQISKKRVAIGKSLRIDEPHIVGIKRQKKRRQD